jgi:hypothetical protein
MFALRLRTAIERRLESRRLATVEIIPTTNDGQIRTDVVIDQGIPQTRIANLPRATPLPSESVEPRLRAQ